MSRNSDLSPRVCGDEFTWGKGRPAVGLMRRKNADKPVGFAGNGTKGTFANHRRSPVVMVGRLMVRARPFADTASRGSSFISSVAASGRAPGKLCLKIGTDLLRRPVFA